MIRPPDAYSGIEPGRRPEQNAAMSRPGRKRGIHGVLAWVGAAVLCTISAHAPAQVGAPLINFHPTMEDVAPGIDHGNSDDNLPARKSRPAQSSSIPRSGTSI
jgi:hypothetical protein